MKGVLAFLILIPSLALAQPTGTLRGKVVDAKTDETLPGANIVIDGTYRGTAANGKGEFRIPGLESGGYDLRVSFIGYETKIAEIFIYPDSSHNVNIALEPGALQMGEVMVTASRQVEEVSQTTVSASVLTSEAAMIRNSLRLDQALESVPGVNLMAENVNIRNSTGYTRGLGSRVLILLDGVPVLISDFGNMNWDILPVTDISRVEVLKGPASAIYGSFALGGVMNVITHRPTYDGKFSIRTTAGLYDKPYYKEWEWTDRTLNFNRTDVSYSKQVGKFGFRFAAGRHYSTGDRVNRHFTRWNGSGKIIFTPNRKSELTMWGSYARDRRGEFVWSSFDNPYLVDPEFEDFSLSLDAYSFYTLYRHKFSNVFEVNARVSYVRQLTGNQFKVEGDFQPAQGPGANVYFQIRPHRTLDWTTGVDYKFDYAEQRHFGKHTAYTLSPYFQQVWQPNERFKLTVGARYDYYNLLPAPEIQDQFFKAKPIINPLPDGQTEDHFSPQIGASYRFFDNTVFHMAFGTGIRIPSLAERFMSFTIPIEFRGNSNLVTENSQSVEAGIRQDIGGAVHFEVTAFSNTYENLIEPVYVADISSFFATLINIQQARINGVEFGAKFSFFDNIFALKGSTTFTDPIIQLRGDHPGIQLPFETGDYLSYRPKLIAYVSPELNLGPVQLAADFSYASKLDRVQVQVFKDDPRVAKKQLDVRASWRISNLMIQAIVRNVLHYNYTLIERNYNEVRNAALALRWDY